MYKYIYYQIYKWSYNAFGKDDLPELNALLAISLFCFINLLTLGFAIDKFLSISLMEFGSNRVLLISFLLLILLINYFILMHKGRGKAIIMQYDNLPISKNHKKKYIVFGYFLFSLVALIAVI